MLDDRMIAGPALYLESHLERFKCQVGQEKMPEVPSSPYSYGLGLKYLSVDANDLASSPLPQTRLAEAETFSICVLHRCSNFEQRFKLNRGKQKMIRLNR